MASVKHDLIHGVFWSAVEKYSGVIIGICISMVLARLLSPKEYGVVAIAVVFINFISMFCTMGIGPAVIQRKDLTPKDINIIFTFTLIVGLVLGAIFFSCSWWISDFYKMPILVPVCQILSLQVFFSAANMVPNALMSRDKHFKNLARRNLTLQVICGPLAIVAAYYGAGVYALLISPTITSTCIFLWNRHYYPVKIVCKLFNFSPIKKIFSFSLYQFLFDFVNYFSRNFDKLIISKAVNITALGIYDVSYRLMQYPMQNISFVINPVLQPVLKDLQDDKVGLSREYNKIIKFLATLSFPIGIMCFFLASELIHVFCGNKWDAAIPVFRVLALSLPFQMIFATQGSIFTVCNNTKLLFWNGMRNMIVTLSGFVLAAIIFRTIVAVAWAWTLTHIFNFGCTYWLMYRYALKAPLKPMLKEFLRPALILILLGGILVVANHLLKDTPDIVSLIVKLVITFLASVILIHITKQYNIIQLIKKKVSKQDAKNVSI